MNATQRLGSVPSSTEAAGPASVGLGCGRFVLDDTGVITRCDEQGQRMFGTAGGVLVGRHVSDLVPRLAAKEGCGGWLSPNILFLSYCDIPFRARRLDGSSFISALYFSRVTEHGRPHVTMLVRDISSLSAGHRESAQGAESAWCLE